MSQDRFPSPFEVPTPEGAEGWEQLYNWYHLFGEDRRDLDEQRFWFQDRLHHPGVLHPYDEIQCECWWQALGRSTPASSPCRPPSGSTSASSTATCT